MIYTTLTNKAMRIAYDAHLGQTDKCGQPYIFHPFHLAEQMKDETTVCIALLHDVVEDTSVTLTELAQEFPSEIIEALRLLTRQDGENYFEYIKALRSNAAARTVKLADLAHNSDLTRMTGCQCATSEKIVSLQKRYAKARQILLESAD